MLTIRLFHSVDRDVALSECPKGSEHIACASNGWNIKNDRIAINTRPAEMHINFFFSKRNTCSFVSYFKPNMKLASTLTLLLRIKRKGMKENITRAHRQSRNSGKVLECVLA